MNVYINDVEVFLDGDQLPALTMSLSDLLDPSSIRGTRSTTIRVLNTPESRSVLGSEAMAWNGADTRPTIKFKEGGVTVFESELVVMKVDRNVMECAAIGGNASWFEWAKKTKLRDLIISRTEVVDETFGGDPIYGNIVNGITPDVDLTYAMMTWERDVLLYFVMADFGALEDSTGTTRVPIEAIRPAVRVGPLLKAAFNTVGFNVKLSGSLESELNRQVILSDTTNARSLSISSEPFTGAITVYENGLSLRMNSTGYTLVDVDSAPNVIDGTTINSDPGSRWSASTDKYTVAEDCEMRVSLRFSRVTFPTDGSYDGHRFRVSLWDATDGAEITGKWMRSITSAEAAAGQQFIFADLGPFTALEGHELFVGVQLDDTSTVSSASVTLNGWSGVNHIIFNPDRVYTLRAGTPLRVATVFPDMTVMAFVKAHMAHQCLTVSTDPTSRTVTFTRMDEFLRPPASGDVRSLNGRMDHSTPPAKLYRQRPTKYLYRWKEDSEDVLLNRLNRILPSPGYGNLDVDMGGTDSEVKIEMPYAPTAMGKVLGGKIFPIMRKEGADYQVDDYSITPRLLAIAPMKTGSLLVKLDAFSYVDIGKYPQPYFVRPGAQNMPMAFNDGQIHRIDGELPNKTNGVITRYYSNEHRRLREGRLLECLIDWTFMEISQLDFGQATKLHDGHSEGIYYIQKVDAYRPGQVRAAKTILMQA